MEKASAPVSDNSDGGKFYKMRRGSLTTFSVLHHCPIKQVSCDESKFSILPLNGFTVEVFRKIQVIHFLLSAHLHVICMNGFALFN
jgi:hypothetical protein